MLVSRVYLKPTYFKFLKSILNGCQTLNFVQNDLFFLRNYLNETNIKLFTNI